MGMYAPFASSRTSKQDSASLVSTVGRNARDNLKLVIWELSAGSTMVGTPQYIEVTSLM